MEALQTVTKAANKLGVKVITVYAFLQKTGPVQIQEVKFIMNLPVEFFMTIMSLNCMRIMLRFK